LARRIVRTITRTVTGLIDIRVEHGRLPGHMRLVPKVGGAPAASVVPSG
jgi:hypothetical protein